MKGGAMESIMSKSKFQQAAMVSWLAPIIVIFINGVMRQSLHPEDDATQSVLFALLSAILYLLGLICGVFSFFGIPKMGRKGILFPGSIGSLLNAGMLCFIALSIAHSMRSVREPSPDHSLTLRQYQALGMPTLDHPWTAKDYAQAVSSLEAVRKEDPLQLPRRGSPTSGDLFAQLCFGDGQPPASNSANALERATGSAERIQTLLPIVQIYEAAAKQGHQFHSEMVFLMCRMLEEGSLMSSAIDAYIQEAGKKDPVVAQLRQTESQRIAGTVQMLKGVSQMIKGLQTTGDAQLRHELAQSLDQALPGMSDLLRGIPPEGRSALFIELVNHEHDPDTRAHLESIQNRLQNL
jgi:hypothetical protein